MSDPRYPIGTFQHGGDVSRAQRDEWVRVIATAPQQYRAAVDGLSDAQLDTRYREGGWTIRQVVHHVADSHINSYVRYRLALTEDNPTIKPYAEDRWAELADARMAGVAVSLNLIESIHARWVMLLESMSEEDWGRSFLHPERGTVRLDATAGLYAWHCRHHLAHITLTRERNGW